MESITLLTICVAWFFHLLLLFGISKILSREVVGMKVVGVLYLFYTAPFLVPFKYKFFEANINYQPTLMTMVFCILADLFFIFCIHSTRKIEPLKIDVKVGEQALFTISTLAFVIHCVMNHQLFLLSKNEYIAADKFNNLVFLSIPAEAFILGYFFSKEKRGYIVWLSTICAVGLSFFLGYRHLIFFIILYFIFNRWKRCGIILPFLIMTLFGELSNVIKNLIFALVTVDGFDYNSYFDFVFHSSDGFSILSSEQKAIVSNFHLGFPGADLSNAFPDLLNLFPLGSRLLEGSDTSVATRLGVLMGVGTGQGTAYGYLLFLIESSFLALIFFFITVYFVRIFEKSIFCLMAWLLFFSLMRDSAGYYASQLKMMALSFIFVIVLNSLLKWVRNSLKGQRVSAVSK
ncbi:hypothetical protein [Chromobacterium violaceum]|uniref:hypothetical protein n=1 Tax=Chromobacterium violaceum TaxID=536 RepID=UPI001B31BCF4|nr:hypothetical protein [Chromobacterium violaceum]MBP4046234.1 hypothetical protein [Chromobacterium violaceum]